MLTYLHNIAFAVLPAIVPTPRSKLPPKPTPTETLSLRIEQVKEAMLALHLKRAELRAEEKQLNILLNEYELSRTFFAERDADDLPVVSLSGTRTGRFRSTGGDALKGAAS